ncbi:50S ribosomal protein L3 N(5)-glutamine methyltransferase [Agaribacter flavus]|uniref:50S ribosomal protein L3 N(5)-glutamine methyltransferase n=1 Tax=Agaribacter flavus TaxID=1902781 RepID=A0ABV7FKL0_9ALTE
MNDADNAEHALANVNELTTVVDWMRYTISQLQSSGVYFGHGTDNVWDEAEQLVFTCLQLPLTLAPEQKQILYNASLTQDEKHKALDWIRKRSEEALPLPYISNTAWFAGMPFYVDERVLIPRSPFAELINQGFSSFLSAKDEPLHLLDMCTGSGCIAIALAHAFPEAMVDAVDIDTDALDVTSINIANYQLEQRVYPLASDVFSALSGQQYDIIVANPPYVDAEDMADLPNEYLHEPEHALASGFDGLDLTVQILSQAVQFLRDDGWLFVEVGNSEVNFDRRMKGLHVTWCQLANGGSGIFAISKAQLMAQQDILDELE